MTTQTPNTFRGMNELAQEINAGRKRLILPKTGGTSFKEKLADPSVATYAMIREALISHPPELMDKEEV